MEEPWDELMGPSPEDLKNMLRDESRPADPPVRVRSGASSMAGPPPSAMFSMPSSPPPPPPPPPEDAFEVSRQQHQVTTSRTSTSSRYGSSSVSSPYQSGLRASAKAVPPVTRVRSGLAFEDEDEEDDRSVATNDAPMDDPDAIRQEALKMLEVAEANDSSYAVHRTITGGFTASHRTLSRGSSGSSAPRTRAALSGLSFTAGRTGSSSYRSSYRDAIYDADPTSPRSSAAPTTPTQEDYEYGDSGVVDVAGMERRSMASRPADPPSTGGKNWSSRYSVDNTLLAMAGSSKASRKSVLDRMDRDHDRTSRNLFGGSRRSMPKVFGNGFSFRKDHVFGKQKVTISKPPPEKNLQTVWMDVDSAGASMPSPNPRSKSWQEQLQAKRNQRRTYILAVLVAFCFTITIGSIFGTRAYSASQNNNDSSNAMIPPGSVTFYVTADAPYDLASEDRLQHDLESLSPTASMLIHLGNMQRADVTLCQSSRYANIAALLRQSAIPTFVLPGQEDVNNCPNPVTAMESWINSFRFFHRHFPHSLHVMSEADQNENFAIVQQGVLFLGLHLVGGRVPNPADFEGRNTYNYQWVQGMTDKFAEEIRAVVILANARPGEPMNKALFADLQEYWRGVNMPIAYVHANSYRPAVGTQVYTPFEGLDHVYGIQVGNSGDNPPLRLNVGFGDRPFIVG